MVVAATAARRWQVRFCDGCFLVLPFVDLFRPTDATHQRYPQALTVLDAFLQQDVLVGVRQQVVAHHHRPECCLTLPLQSILQLVQERH